MPDFDVNENDNRPWKQYIYDIREVEIGEGVTSIGNYAFYKCSDLTDIMIPDSVIDIRKNSFKNNNIEPIRIYCTKNSEMEKYLIENDADNLELVYKYLVTDSDFGANGNDEEDDSDAIQKALDIAINEIKNNTDQKICVFVPNGNYYINKMLYIYSNTILKLDDTAVIKNSIGKKSMLFASHLGEDGKRCESNCNHGGYTQWENIIVEGGTWDFNNDGSANLHGLWFAHGKNLIVRNTTLINSAGHALNPSCSQKVLIDSVIFKNQISSENGDLVQKPNNTNEILHLDSAGSGEPGIYSDGTPVDDVVITNCIFDNVFCAIGSHTDYSDEKMIGNKIKIEGNIFNNIQCYGINLYAHKNVEIAYNTAKGYNPKNIISDSNEAYGFVQTMNAGVNIHDNNVENFEYMLVKSKKNSKYTIEGSDLNSDNTTNRFHILTFDSNGGQGDMDYQIRENESKAEFTLNENKFIRSGYKFIGWTMFKNYPASLKYKCNEMYKNDDWQTQETIDAQNLTKYIYKDKDVISSVDQAWWHHSEVIMTAQWLEVVTVKDEPNFIEKIIEVDGKKYIVPKKGTNVGELLSDLKLNINEDNNSALKIKEQSSTEFINDESILKTDQKIVIDNPEEDTGKIIVSTGDLNSDGNVDIRDISKLNNYRINKEKAEAQWTVSQKLAFKCLKELDTTDAEMGTIGLRDIVSLNNYRIKVNSESTYIKIDYKNDNEAYFSNFSLPFVSNADPFIIKQGDCYYLFSTGSEKGLYYSKSYDFKNWSDKSIIFRNPDSTKYRTFWAPEVYNYNSKFYLLATAVLQKDENNVEHKQLFIAETDDLNDEFTNFRIIDVGLDDAIDGNLLFDDGKIYLYYKNELIDNTEESRAIYVIELDEEFSKKTEQGKLLLSPKIDPKTYEKNLLEGPFCIKHDNKYYLMYSTGFYTDGSYTVGYAISDSPMGSFIKEDNALLKGEDPLINETIKVYDSENNIYGSGHNMILKISDDEFYTIYHSSLFKNNKFEKRKFNADRIGFDSDGKMFVNGPSKIEQPLPSGSNNYYQLTNEYYSITADEDTTPICDEVNYLYNNTNVDTITTKNLNITLNKEMDVCDVWLFGNGESFNNIKVNICINDKLIIEDLVLGTDSYCKLQLPLIKNYIKNIKIMSENNLNLSEVKIIANILEK